MNNIIFKLAYYLAVIAFRIAFNIKIEGKENIPEGAFIIAPNHRTNADPPVVAIAAGYSRYAFIAKEELFKSKLFGGLIKWLGAFPVSRGKGDSGAIDVSIEKLKEGRRLVIFPEGTRSKTGKVGRGKTGVALIAAKSGYTVVPAGIIFGEKLHFRSKITVKFGKPILPGEFKLSAEPAPNELKEVKKKIMDSITELVEGEKNG